MTTPSTPQGSVSVEQASIIYKPSSAHDGQVSLIQVCNTQDAAYTFTLFRSRSGVVTQLYSFAIEAGDVLQDSGPYLIEDGDALLAQSSVHHTLFSVESTENPSK